MVRYIDCQLMPVPHVWLYFWAERHILLTYLGILENLGRWRSQDEGNPVSLLWCGANKVAEAIRSFR